MPLTRRDAVRGLAAATVLAAASSARAADDDFATLCTKSNAALAAFMTNPEWRGVRNVMGASKAIIIAPEIVAGSFLVGYESGSGVLIARIGDEWSDPAFIQLHRESVGFQAGVTESKQINLLLTRDAVNSLVDGVSRVAGSGGFALGNLGAGASGAGGVSGGLQLLSVQTSSGFALGSGIARMTLSMREDANRAAYGADFNLKGVLDKAGGRLPAAAALRATLAEATRTAWNE